jgi:gluconate 5-dehydrogenase
MNKFSLEGKIALVTGGGAGIGLAITECFIEAGAEVVITGRRQEVLEETANKLGSKVHVRANDITDLNSLPSFVKEIEDFTKRLSLGL